MKILGIDLGKYNSVACLLDTESSEHLFFAFKTFPTEIKDLLSHSEPELIVFEACALSGWVYDLCQEAQVKTIVANTNEDAWSWKHVKRKTDKDDALKLTKLAALDLIHPVYIPPAESRQYRQLVKYRKRLVGRCTQIQNTIRALFNHQGIPIPRGGQAWTIAGLEELSQYRKPLAQCDALSLWQGQLDSELELLDGLWDELHTVDTQLTAIARADSRVQIVESIPGVGRKTAEVIVAYIDDAKRFKTARQVSAYAGLVPRQNQSGGMNQMGRITRRGPKILRTSLVEAAWAMQQFNPWAKAVYERLCGGLKKRKKQAIVGVARKLLVLCWTLLRKQERWDPQKAMIASY